MARIKSLRLKEKRYVFDVMKNKEQSEPMACVFRRFPLPDEDFPYAEPIELSDELARSLTRSENKEEAVKEMMEAFIPKFLENVKRGRVDYKRFVGECVERFENIEYEDRKIATTDDFLSLPDDLFYKLAQNAYIYATERDAFSLEEKNELAKP